MSKPAHNRLNIENQVQKLYSEGFKPKEISKIIGCSASSVYGCLHRLGTKLSIGRPRGDWHTRPADGYVVRNEYDSDGTWKLVLQHRSVMEQILGRPLETHENVHHINGVRNDNRAENLELWSTIQPSGQRPCDKIEYAVQILSLYAPEKLVKDP